MPTSHKHRTVLLAVHFVLSAFLFGCSGGGGESGGSIGISDGQDPDPAVLDVAIAYVMRPLPVDDDGSIAENDLRDPAAFNPGAALYVRDRASPSSAARNITAGVFPDGELYDVKDLSASYDGSRLLFSMRAPEVEGLDDDEQPSWNIWEFNMETDELRRIVSSDLTAEEGQDISPQYLADNSIVFTSTRQRESRALLLDEGKPQFAALDENRQNQTFVLHKMDEDGGDIVQLTFNQSHDMNPSVLDDGRIVFSRWDGMGARNSVNLYTVNPDGSGLQILYGNHSHNTGSNGATVQFMQARQNDDGLIIAALRPFDTLDLGGEIVAIDTDNFTDQNQPTAENMGLAGPAQQSASLTDVVLDQAVSPGGRYASAFPLRDGTQRVIASWSQCRLVIDNNIVPCTEQNLANTSAVPADPLYGIWMFDMSDESQLPVVAPEEGVMFTDVITLQDRVFPDDLGSEHIDADLADQGLATLHIASVYDFDGADVANPNIATLADPSMTPASDRPARFLRIVKAVSIPDEDVHDFSNTAFGRSAQQLMREILGYVPVEPDGSVKVTVPARVAFALSVVDENGRRVGGRHQNWLHLQPGESMECKVCHTSQSEMPHGRYAAQADSANPGALNPTIEFPNTTPALFADAIGETMAEVYARIMGTRSLSVDLEYNDEWSVPADVDPATEFAYRYADLNTSLPVSAECATQWQVLCRSTINYETHIQPLWDLPRTAVDAGDPVQNQTCTACHAAVDDMGAAQVPAAQLDLSSMASADEPDHLTSYRELLFQDNEQEEVGGAIIDRLVPSTDDDGNPILVTVPVNPIMTVAGGNASNAFFTLFATGGTHEAWLSAAELRLLSEWLDVGGQYYNNPFAAPIQ
ncbi:MAG: hypothetical protein AAF542_18670 [Pseudomonadota bacterium]